MDRIDPRTVTRGAFKQRAEKVNLLFLLSFVSFLGADDSFSFDMSSAVCSWTRASRNKSFLLEAVAGIMELRPYSARRKRRCRVLKERDWIAQDLIPYSRLTTSCV